MFQNWIAGAQSQYLTHTEMCVNATISCLQAPGPETGPRSTECDAMEKCKGKTCYCHEHGCE